MPHKSAGFTVLLVCALLAGTARADDAHKPPAPAPDPDPGFLEFLGSVDGLADVNPDYLAQAKVARPPPPAAPAGAAVKPPPAAPAAPPPASAAGVKNNE
jgi:hypothetical protein